MPPGIVQTVHWTPPWTTTDLEAAGPSWLHRKARVPVPLIRRKRRWLIQQKRTAPAEQVPGSLVSGNYFSVLGAGAVLGRTISPADDATPGSGAVVVVSFPYWQQALVADATVGSLWE